MQRNRKEIGAGATKKLSIFFFKSVRGVHARASVKRRSSEMLENRATAREVSHARVYFRISRVSLK